MRILIGTGTQLLLHCLLITVSGAIAAHAAVDPKFKLDTKTLKDISPPLNSSQRKQQQPTKPVKRIVAADNETILTVKPGDTIERLLMRDCSLTSEETAPLIEEVRKRNKILNIRRLFIGQKIIVPPLRCTPPGVAGKSPELPPGNASADKRQAVAATPLGIEPPKAPDQNKREPGKISPAIKSETPKSAGKPVSNPVIVARAIPVDAPKPVDQTGNAIAMLIPMWEKIVPARQGALKPLTFKSGSFTLTLDPARYPVFTAMDGSRILIDQKRSIPPQYLPLIVEQEPTLRIVTEPAVDGKRFLASLLDASRFYSVEENCWLEFGVDPKLTVRTDFKVERTAESLFRNDVLLLNAEKAQTAPALIAFLKKEGFILHEPFSTKPQPPPAPRNRLVQVTSKRQPEIVDAILSALSLPVKRNQYLEVASPNESGINLSIKIDRSIEHNGRRYVILCSGDPVASAISAILESSGIHVVALEAGDYFSTVAEKILAGLEISGTYGFHQLWPIETSNYSLQLSGILLEERETDGGSLFITDREIDGVIRDIASENGYNVYQK